MKKYYGLAVAAVMFLSGCALKEAPPLNYYSLDIGKMPVVEHSKYRNKVLKVAYPKPLTEKLTDRISFSYSSSDRGIYQNSQWSNTLEKLLEGNIIAALQQSRLFKAVLPYSSTAGVDLRLESMIYDFSHHVRGDASYAVVSIEFALIDTHTGKLIKTKRFSYRENTRTTNAKGYVEASNIILHRMGKDLINWLK
jgi:cholesterol transport system auxiliary component